MLEKIKALFSKKAFEWYEPEDPTPREQCPYCDYISLPERGNYLICPVCFWEDDGQDIDELDVGSGPNHGITLREGRKNFKDHGACEIEMVKHVVSVEQREQFKYVPRNL
ncbi:CPCC family cysteine-rich protein [Microbulbifer sp. MKSA007]|nr:CPCC family cysteine-rich protein [Microbulbifer sp. MKSA007]